jgi:hypothetical protein
MALAQLTYRESLRDIEACLRSISGKLNHMGFRGKVSRTILADANERHDWRIYSDFAQVLIRIARALYAQDPLGVDLAHSLYALDSTTIDLCLSLFPWAKFRKHKAAVKMHTLLDLHGNIPTFISITDGKVHDVNILDEILPEAGAFYVMDRGYVDFERLYRFTLSSAFFVVRTKSNVLLQRRYSQAVDKTTDVRSDHTVILTAIDSAKAYPDALRRVRYLDVETRKRFKFLTNNFTLPALTIAQIYKCRWQVELFFESSTWCTPLDAMTFRGSIALNRPLVGAMDGSVRPRIARRAPSAESRVRPYRPATQATVSAESAASMVVAQRADTLRRPTLSVCRMALIPIQDRGDPRVWFDPRQHANDLHQIIVGDVPMPAGANPLELYLRVVPALPMQDETYRLAFTRGDDVF